MKLLICGDALSQFTIDFSTHLKKFDDVEIIDIVNIRTIKTTSLIEQVGDCYNVIYNFQPLSLFFEKIPKIRVLIRKIYESQVIRTLNLKIPGYDVILLHGFWAKNCEILNRISLEKQFVVGSFWGSDLFKINEFNLTGVKLAIEKCNLLNLPNRKMIDIFLDKFSFDIMNFRSCLFGLAPLETLSEIESIDLCTTKDAIGLNHNEFVITCGYNGSENQQHLLIIESIISIREFLPKNYILLFPMTYGGNVDYHNTVENTLKTSGLKFRIFKKFLSNLDVAYLRKATNIFIQLQISDSFSGSMQEHLFAQNIVITGRWLSYDILHEKGFYFEEIGNISDLSNKLIYVLENYEALCLIVNTNNTLEKFSDSYWRNSIVNWYNMLSEYKSYKMSNYEFKN